MSWRFNPHAEIEELKGTSAIPGILAIQDDEPTRRIAGIARLATPAPENSISELVAPVPIPPLGPAEAAGSQEPCTCWWCGHPHYFINLGGQAVCARCHPPLDPVRFRVH